MIFLSARARAKLFFFNAPPLVALFIQHIYYNKLEDESNQDAAEKSETRDDVADQRYL